MWDVDLKKTDLDFSVATQYLPCADQIANVLLAAQVILRLHVVPLICLHHLNVNDDVDLDLDDDPYDAAW